MLSSMSHYSMCRISIMSASHATLLKRTIFCVTTRWVLAEVANALGKSADRDKVGEFLADLELDPLVRIVGEGDELYRRGLALYRARADKLWSLTDCISFVVMEREGLHEALTGDRHFTQAGFVALFAN
jgi:predicted nucleic acid-binding protein